MFTWGYFALSFCSSARSIVACSCREGGGGIFSAESSTFFSSIFSLTQTWHVKLQQGKVWSMTSVVNKSRVILTDFKMKDKAFKRLGLRASTRFLQSFPLKYPFQKLKVFSCNTGSKMRRLDCAHMASKLSASPNSFCEINKSHGLLYSI